MTPDIPFMRIAKRIWPGKLMVLRNGVQSDVIERQPCSCEGNQVRAAYNHARYLSERGKMMQWSADYLNGVGQKAQIRLFKTPAQVTIVFSAGFPIPTSLAIVAGRFLYGPGFGFLPVQSL